MKTGPSSATAAASSPACSRIPQENTFLKALGNKTKSSGHWQTPWCPSSSSHCLQTIFTHQARAGHWAPACSFGVPWESLPAALGTPELSVPTPAIYLFLLQSELVPECQGLNHTSWTMGIVRLGEDSMAEPKKTSPPAAALQDSTCESRQNTGVHTNMYLGTCRENAPVPATECEHPIRRPHRAPDGQLVALCDPVSSRSSPQGSASRSHGRFSKRAQKALSGAMCLQQPPPDAGKFFPSICCSFLQCQL